MTPEEIQEVAEKAYPSLGYRDEYYLDGPLKMEQPAFIAGITSETAKKHWQERMYSPEEIDNLIEYICSQFDCIEKHAIRVFADKWKEQRKKQ